MENKECGLCHKCAYKTNIPGDAHIGCGLDWSKSEHDMPKGNPHGFKMGWYMFPANFDPVWQVTPCQEFSTEKNPDKVSSDSGDPFMQLVRMISGIR
jgi:hypothetical protein